jgi:endonuclease IV
MPLYLGIHIFKGKGYVEEMERSHFNAFQIFVSGPRNSQSTVDIATCEHIADFVKSIGGRLFIHSNYITKISVKSISTIQTQMTLAKACGAEGLVVHTNPKMPTETIPAILNTIKAHLTDQVPILLESPGTHATDYTYETPEKINSLLHALRGTGVKFVFGQVAQTYRHANL